jgi:hypothetical protein
MDCDDEGGPGPGNHCEEAWELQMQAIEDACSSYMGECCYCDCVVNGSSSLPDCDCSDYVVGDPSEVECEGDAEAAAEACLDDPDACAENLEDMVELICSM